MCAIYWLISMFGCLCLHTSVPLVFCYVLKRVVYWLVSIFKLWSLYENEPVQSCICNLLWLINNFLVWNNFCKFYKFLILVECQSSGLLPYIFPYKYYVIFLWYVLKYHFQMTVTPRIFETHFLIVIHIYKYTSYAAQIHGVFSNNYDCFSTCSCGNDSSLCQYFRTWTFCFMIKGNLPNSTWIAFVQDDLLTLRFYLYSLVI